MKKILILAALGIGAYLYFGKKKDETNEEAPQDFWVDFFEKYNNHVIYDRDGYWMLVKNGRLSAPKSEMSLQTYYDKNPAYSTPVYVDESVWLHYSNKDSNLFDLNGF